MAKAWKAAILLGVACTFCAGVATADGVPATCGPTPALAPAVPVAPQDLILLAVPRVGTQSKMLYAALERTGEAPDGADQRQALLVNGAAALTWANGASSGAILYAYVDTNADGLCSAGDALYSAPVLSASPSQTQMAPDGWRIFLQDMPTNPKACEHFQNNVSRTAAFALSLDATAGNPRKVDHVQAQKNSTTWRLELSPTLTPEAFAAGGTFTLTLQDAQGATIQVIPINHVWSDVQLRY